jgi:hypothetical protein
MAMLRGRRVADRPFLAASPLVIHVNYYTWVFRVGSLDSSSSPRPVWDRGGDPAGCQSEQDAELAQKSGQLQPFPSCIPAGMRGPTRLFWADLTPSSLKERTVAASAITDAGTVRARPGWLSALSISHSESVLRGGSAWGRGALNRGKRRFPAPRATVCLVHYLLLQKVTNPRFYHTKRRFPARAGRRTARTRRSCSPPSRTGPPPPRPPRPPVVVIKWQLRGPSEGVEGGIVKCPTAHPAAFLFQRAPYNRRVLLPSRGRPAAEARAARRAAFNGGVSTVEPAVADADADADARDAGAAQGC